MGYVFDRDILMTLAALEAVLQGLGHKCTPGLATKTAAATLAGAHPKS